MEIRRTANAGILLKLDGVTLLLDGVSQAVQSYLATPPDIRDCLLSSPPDALVFTHWHEDHYDPDFAAAYQRSTDGVIIGPQDLIGTSPVSKKTKIGTVSVIPVKSRHIGKVSGCEHFSYVIQGSKTIYFFGDASPLQWHPEEIFQKPDVVVVPFAYASSASSWKLTRALGAKTVVVIHMPSCTNDPMNLWQSVENTIADDCDVDIRIPTIGETIFI